jgi:DNA anti-recombination protein RmuC
MPVAAKFSKQFYDKFGHELTDELVSYLNQIDSSYRSELRELNELNFARFDAKLEQRVAQLDAKIEVVLSTLDAKLEQRIAELRAELRTELHTGLATLETKLIRWMFVFWAGSTLTILGTMLALLQG